MKKVETVNGYVIYAYSKGKCKANYMPYPTYGAFALYEANLTPEFEECSMGSLDELKEWCKRH